MYNTTTKKTEEERHEIGPLTEEDKQEIADIFDSYSASKFLGMEGRRSTWQQPSGSALEGLTIVDAEDICL